MVNVKTVAKVVGTAPTALVAARSALDALDTLLKDERVSAAGRRLLAQLAKVSPTLGKTARLEKQLSLIEEYARSAAAGAEAGSEGDGAAARPAQAGAWLAQAQELRSRVPLAAAMKGSAGRKAMKQLDVKAAELMSEILSRD